MSDILPDIISLKPYWREMVWGGRHLEALYGKALPPTVAIGETFELSAYEERESTVANGECAGLALRELVAAHGAELVGAGVWDRYDGRFPLLVKLIDAQQDLSIQVHPDDAYARLKGLDDAGKMEAWYVLHSENGRAAYGLHEGGGRSEFAAAVAAQRVADGVRFFPVSRGDLVFSPPGTVHALCAGVVIYEVQQSSDLTFRIYDYDRPGLDGQPRELHIEQAMDVINFGAQMPAPVPHPKLEGDEVLVASEHFVLRGCGLVSGVAELRAESSFLAVTLIAGQALAGGCRLPTGTTALVPAGRTCEIAQHGDEKLEYLVACVPT